MCDHKKLEYLGDQECSNGEFLSLYNCVNCGTTITLNTAATHDISINSSPVSMLGSKTTCVDDTIL